MQYLILCCIYIIVKAKINIFVEQNKNRFMKSIKFLSLVLMLSLAVGLTSCLNGNDDSDQTYSGIVEVVSTVGNTYFQTSDGTKIVPTSTSLSSVQTNYKFTATSGLAYIVYSTTASSTSSTGVTLTYAVSLQNNTVTAIKGGENDIAAQLPIISLDPINTTTTNKVVQYNNNTLLLATNIYFSITSNAVPTHTLSLVFYPNEVSGGDDEMHLFLRHQSTDTGASYYSAYYIYNLPYLYFRSYNIASQLSLFESKAGSTPKTITIHYPINSSDLTLPTEEETASVTYQTK
jgi:hypothetical protein